MFILKLLFFSRPTDWQQPLQRSQVRVGDMTSIKISSDSKYALINYAPNVCWGAVRGVSTPDRKLPLLDRLLVGYRERTAGPSI